MSETNTIVACATPSGHGGVAVLRLSGPKALSIALTISKRKTLSVRYAQFAEFYDPKDEIIDQGIIIYFKAPYSFTGEDVIEFQCHGSPVAVDRLIKSALHLGAELAKPGEFSERAFLNDKIDLTQAEAIADLIHAHSDTAARKAVKSLQGEFSNKIRQLSEQIIQLRLYVEAAIDFPDEEIDFLNDGRIVSQLEQVIDTLENICSQTKQGVILQEGLSVVIAGRPNAGKSTLINHLAGQEVAIVTDIAGTTRDVMREHVLLDDIPVHVIDTAGIHDSDDPIEKEGMKRAWAELKKADCVLSLVDMTVDDAPERLSKEIKMALPDNIPVVIVFNKIDALGIADKAKDNEVYLSAKTGKGVIRLKNKIKSLAGYQAEEGQYLARRRHLNALHAAKQYLLNGQTQLQKHRAGELLAEDLRLAHQSLCEITGEFSSDDLLGKIFSNFCIGK